MSEDVAGELPSARSKKWWIVGAVLVLVCVLVVGITWFGDSSADERAEQAAPSPKPSPSDVVSESQEPSLAYLDNGEACERLDWTGVVNVTKLELPEKLTHKDVEPTNARYCEYWDKATDGSAVIYTYAIFDSPEAAMASYHVEPLWKSPFPLRLASNSPESWDDGRVERENPELGHRKCHVSMVDENLIAWVWIARDKRLDDDYEAAEHDKRCVSAATELMENTRVLLSTGAVD